MIHQPSVHAPPAPPARRLDGTVSLVTGASTGLGESIARALAAEGSAVSLVARSEERLTAVAAGIARVGGTALVAPADITAEGQARDAVARTVAQLGRLDVLVNNAGVSLIGPMLDAPPAEWQCMIDLNLSALLAVTRAALPHLLTAATQEPRRVADLVNISSVAGRRVPAGAGVYAATKAAVCTLSEALRQEVTRRYVRVGVIEPGATRTDWARRNRTELHEAIAERSGEFEQMEPEDIANAVVYMVTQPRRAAVNELLVRPTDQAT